MTRCFGRKNGCCRLSAEAVSTAWRCRLSAAAVALTVWRCRLNVEAVLTAWRFPVKDGSDIPVPEAVCSARYLSEGDDWACLAFEAACYPYRCYGEVSHVSAASYARYRSEVREEAKAWVCNHAIYANNNSSYSGMLCD